MEGYQPLPVQPKESIRFQEWKVQNSVFFLEGVPNIYMKNQKLPVERGQNSLQLTKTIKLEAPILDDVNQIGSAFKQKFLMAAVTVAVHFLV
jgi:hypothetical protein